MEDVRHVLFPTDFSDFSYQALSHLADLLHGDMELHIVNGARRGKADESNPKFQAGIADVVHRLRELGGADGPQLKRIHARQIGGIAPALVAVEYAKTHHIDLIVLATHGSRGLKRFFLGGVAREIHELASCHVLSVRGEKTAPYSRLLVPVDFSRQSQASLKVAANIAKHNNAALHILHVIEDQISSTLVVTGRKALLDVIPDLEKRTTNRLTKMVRATGCPHAFIHVRTGKVVREVQQTVKRHGIDLIIMAGDRETDHVLGSTTQMILHYIDTTVLVLRRL